MTRSLQINAALLVFASLVSTASWADSSSQSTEQARKLKQQYEENKENITHAGDYKSSSSTTDMPVLFSADVKKDDAVAAAQQTN